MKLTQSQLQQIIQEELEKVLKEDFGKSFKKAANWDEMSGEIGTATGTVIGDLYKGLKGGARTASEYVGLRKPEKPPEDLLRKWPKKFTQKKLKYAPCQACINKCKHTTSCGQEGSLFRHCAACAVQCEEEGHCSTASSKLRRIRAGDEGVVPQKAAHLQDRPEYNIPDPDERRYAEWDAKQRGKAKQRERWWKPKASPADNNPWD